MIGTTLLHYRIDSLIGEGGMGVVYKATDMRRERSVANLPFVNLRPDQENEFLCDGMCEALLTALTLLPGLRVPARTSSFAYKGKSEDIRRIGQLGPPATSPHLSGTGLRSAGSAVALSPTQLAVLGSMRRAAVRIDCPPSRRRNRFQLLPLRGEYP